MEFKHYYRDDIQSALEITKDNPYTAITVKGGQSGDTVIVTEAIFNKDNWEDARTLESLKLNKNEADLFQEYVMLVHTEMLDLYKDELYYREDGWHVSHCDELKKLYAAHQPEPKFVEKAPIIEEDWEVAKWILGEDTASYVYDIVDNPARQPFTEEFVAKNCVALYNEGIIKGWSAYREMVKYKEKLANDMKFQLQEILEKKELNKKGFLVY